MLGYAAPFEHQAFLAIDTGAIYWASETNLIEEDDVPDDLDTSDQYIAIPHKNDLDLGSRLALRFAEEELPHQVEAVAAVFRHRGAYGRFKEILATAGCLEKWYAYEAAATERALRDWCKEHQIQIFEDENQG